MKLSRMLLGILIGAVFIAVWIAIVDLGAVAGMLSKISFLPLAAASFAWVVAFFIGSLRWNIILRIASPTPISRTYALYMFGAMTDIFFE